MLIQKKIIFLITYLFLSFTQPLLSSPPITCCSYQQWPECLFRTLRCTKKDIKRAHQHLGHQLQLVQGRFCPEQTDHTLTWADFLRHSENTYLLSSPTVKQWCEWVSHIKYSTYLGTFLKSPGALQFFTQLTPEQSQRTSNWLRNEILQYMNDSLMKNQWEPLQIWSLQYSLEHQVCKHIECPWLDRSHHKNQELFHSLPSSIRSQITSSGELLSFINMIPQHWLETIKEENYENLFLTFQLIKLQMLDLKHKNLPTLKGSLPKWIKSRPHFIKAVTPSVKSQKEQDSTWAVWWNGEIVHAIKKNHGLQRLFRKHQQKNKDNDIQHSTESAHKIACRVLFVPLTSWSDKMTMLIQVDPDALPESIEK
ncbi:MAG: hypothetical protein AB8C84_13360 [Oligoflexales bacterium]